MTSDFALQLRPKSLSEICGQKAIIAEMKKRSLTGDFPSVMIFAGASGTGKTTLALLIGTLINDSQPIMRDGYVDPNPESPEYKAVYSESYNRNVAFYDASKMNKDDVVNLEDVVGSKSLFGGKKVIIIDEAQELGRHSKGATLKLLEKKRQDSHIILCTMNPEAFDKSIRSRGQFYTFRSPSSSDIAQYLYSLAEKENVELPDEFLTKGIFTVAENCEGSVRMAVQTFERCLTAGLYSSEEIQQEFGFLSTDNLVLTLKELLQRKPDVFIKLQALDLKDFFYQSYRMIQEVLVYLRTGVCETPVKKTAYETFRPFKLDLAQLFNLYSRIDERCKDYFQPNYALVTLSEFLEMAQPIRIAANRAAVTVR